MRFSSFILALVVAAFPIAETRADNCQFTFRCQGNICERALPSSCSVNVPTANVLVNAPPASTTTFDAPITGRSPNTSASVFTENSSDNPPPTPAPPYGSGCAENGSCYGDVSNINGMPKTNPVSGYFRRDGTYVRGHYRSSGRR